MNTEIGLSNRFAISKQHADPGRAQRSFNTDTAKEFAAWVASLLPADHMIQMDESVPQIVQKASSLVAFPLQNIGRQRLRRWATFPLVGSSSRAAAQW